MDQKHEDDGYPVVELSEDDRKRANIAIHAVPLVSRTRVPKMIRPAPPFVRVSRFNAGRPCSYDEADRATPPPRRFQPGWPLGSAQGERTRGGENGRASGRERVGEYVMIRV